VGKPQTAEGIVAWADKQTPPANTPKYDRITRADLEILRTMRKAGKSQTEIAQALGCTQGTVSKWLAALTDTTDIAREYMAGKALSMAKNVVRNGQARDHIQALKGLRVLEPDNSNVNIAIGVSLPGLTKESVSGTPAVTVSPLPDSANG
jgi:DNA-binding CsgD family transcriptional regulator